MITLIHYGEAFEQPPILSTLMTELGFTRHAFVRILYLAPIVWAGLLFGWRGGVLTSLLALAAMLPRAISISSSQIDAVFEAGGVFIGGNVLAMTFYTLRKERQYRKQLEEAQEKLHFYLGQVNKAQEEERKRISHELHDDTIQSLVVLSRQLDILASNDKGMPEEYRRRLEELRQQTNDIMLGVRRLSQDLRPAALDRLGLISALEWLTEDIAKYSGIKIKLSVNGETQRLSEEKELVLFRIAQESLRNVWRHSKASEAGVTIESDKDKIRIAISDNGQGFEIPQNMSALSANGKLGLAGMRERAKLLGGNLIVRSQPGEGVSIIVELPL
ncbi:histidine kinase [Chloroflexota bacterium]